MIKFKLKKTDRSYMVVELRAMDSISMAPSNVSDLYDIDHIRKRLLGFQDSIRVFLDNNVLTRVLNLPVEGRSKPRTLTEEEKSVCVFMAYFVYCGHLPMPDIAMYESESTPTPESRVKAEIVFRYFDHLPPQMYMDLARERTNIIPLELWSAVKNEVDNNPITQENIALNTYTESIDSQKAFYLSLLKAWLVYREKIKFEAGFELLMDWIYQNSLIEQNSVLFYVFLLKRNRLSSLIKKIDSNDSEVIFRNIHNAAWDLTHLNYFYTYAQKHYKKGVICFCSRDRLCHELLDVSLSIKSESEFMSYLSDNYSKKQFSLISKLHERHNNRTSVSAYVESVVGELDARIGNMEIEVKQYLTK